jgi:hypothetical protein
MWQGERMSDTPQAKDAPRERASGNYIAGAIALLALAVVAAAWLWTTRQPPSDAGLGLPHGVIVVGVCTFVTALIAAIRSMSLWDVLEMLLEAFLGLLSLVGAVLKGIWSFICGLFGWN